MADLEHITVNKLHKLCNLANCIDMYFFVATYCDIEAHTGLYRKVKRVLSELLAEHWGEMICQTNSATVRSDSEPQPPPTAFLQPVQQNGVIGGTRANTPSSVDGAAQGSQNRS